MVFFNHLKNEKTITSVMEMAEGGIDWWRMDGNDQSMILFLLFVIGSEAMEERMKGRFEMMAMKIMEMAVIGFERLRVIGSELRISQVYVI